MLGLRRLHRQEGRARRLRLGVVALGLRALFALSLPARAAAVYGVGDVAGCAAGLWVLREGVEGVGAEGGGWGGGRWAQRGGGWEGGWWFERG